jgi:DNA-directed RNA polymerase specialized sigma24 family protein
VGGAPPRPSATDALPAEGRRPASRLRSLPRREREVVLFGHYLDLSERQTAEVLGLCPGSVKAYGSRGLAGRRTLLGEALDHEEDPR